MKRIFFVFIIISLAYTSRGQENRPYLLDSIVENVCWCMPDCDPLRKTIYSYNANGNRTMVAEYSWDSMDNDWYGQWKEVNVYDSVGDQMYFARYACYDTYIDTWIMSVEDYYYRSDHTTFPLNDIKIELGQLNVFPNPFSEYTTVILLIEENITRIELLDITGKNISIHPDISKNSATLFRGDLPSGIYLLIIYSDKTYSTKIIIE